MLALLLTLPAFAPHTLRVIGPQSPAVTKPAPLMVVPDAGALQHKVEILQNQLQLQFLLQIPLGYFTVQKGIDFLRNGKRTANEPRELSQTYAQSARRNRAMDGQPVRQGVWADRDARRVNSYGDGSRSAPDIMSDGLENLGWEPFGWFFGPPSDLYSNVARRLFGQSPTARSNGRREPAVSGRRREPLFNDYQMRQPNQPPTRINSPRNPSSRQPGFGNDRYYSGYEGRVAPGLNEPVGRLSPLSKTSLRRRQQWLNGPPPV